ncbi:NADPH dehydrogenase NamA [Aureibacillus halotolerans]|uniref:NADPH2 dehydrogenase n=1 Tax=Aureibacillus halotolerans TaxID=1508390 RepID=A0A4R6TVG6_9BACI|nr:NADPH dehydrogenase NamA [Aureibacillus halotolerans]TDQ35440.1 NADPH2 dehydrogenase [Aureibacillus halotolerans]
MTPTLFSPYTIKNVTLKNRIVMSPMCMYSCPEEDGKVTNWHRTHYTSRAVGQVGLVMLEASAVLPEGRISTKDLGIWSDEHIEGLSEIVQLLQEHGAKTSIQLAHAGRKSEGPGVIYGPSPIAFSDRYQTPTEMTLGDIERTIQAFKDATERAKKAGFDIIEIHAAHGYLINSFLSPLTNHRTDEYGGTPEKRYRFLQEIIEAVNTVWDGPLFVRISAEDYDDNGMKWQDYVPFAQKMKAQGVNLVDCSTGGVIALPKAISTFPGYQVPHAEGIRKDTNIPTGAVGLITSGQQAEDILQNRQADLIFIGRALLVNPYWALQAANELNEKIDPPTQYDRAW